MVGGPTRRKIAVRQLELIRKEGPGQHKAESLLSQKLDVETLRELVALMAEAILAVARSPEADDE
jgi:hypothetical protein